MAFVGVGRPVDIFRAVVRTVFLLEYISNVESREQIQASTNKVEAYNVSIKWLLFDGDGVIAENDPEEQEKRIKDADVVVNTLCCRMWWT